MGEANEVPTFQKGLVISRLKLQEKYLVDSIGQVSGPGEKSPFGERIPGSFRFRSIRPVPQNRAQPGLFQPGRRGREWLGGGVVASRSRGGVADFLLGNFRILAVFLGFWRQNWQESWHEQNNLGICPNETGLAMIWAFALPS